MDFNIYFGYYIHIYSRVSLKIALVRSRESCTREKQGAILAPPKHQAQGQRLDLLRQRVAVYRKSRSSCSILGSTCKDIDKEIRSNSSGQ